MSPFEVQMLMSLKRQLLRQQQVVKPSSVSFVYSCFFFVKAVLVLILFSSDFLSFLMKVFVLVIINEDN